MERISTLLADIASTYSTDTIFILGKGPSADLVRPEVFSGSLTIGINDAERIAPVDVSIFHADWVVRGLQQSGFRSRLYVTSVDFKPPNRPCVHAPHVPLTQESSDLVLQRFQGDDLVIEDILFVSALKIARMVADLRGRPQTVYMVGFDFTSSVGYSHQIGSNFAPHQTDELHAQVLVQELFFIHLLYFLRGTNLNLKHVGDRAFSAMQAEEVNLHVLGQSVAARRAASSVRVVAELTTNHFGDRIRLERMIRASAAAGADFVKLQKRDVNSFYSPVQLASGYRSPFGSTFSEYRHAIELNIDDFAFVDRLCAEIGIGWFASILDRKSYKFMSQFEPKIIKLPSTISEHLDFIDYVSSTFNGQVVVSTGMTDQIYEDWLLEKFSKCQKLFLMQANSAYPTPLSDCNIGVVRHYQTLAQVHPQIEPAYSSHDFGWKASAMAIAAGATMVEKHVKLGNTEWAHFDAVAVDLTTPDFKLYVEAIREAEAIVGLCHKQVNASEYHKYRLAGSKET